LIVPVSSTVPLCPFQGIFDSCFFIKNTLTPHDKS
jgi:hypothetical protein